MEADASIKQSTFKLSIQNEQFSKVTKEEVTASHFLWGR